MKSKELQILEALHERDRWMRGSIIANPRAPYKVYASAVADGLWPLYGEDPGFNYAKEKNTEVRQDILNRLEEAEKAFRDGYRLKESERHVRGIAYSIPDCLIWREVPAGYIAMSEAIRVQYLIKKNLPSKADQEYVDAQADKF